MQLSELKSSQNSSTQGITHGVSTMASQAFFVLIEAFNIFFSMNASLRLIVIKAHEAASQKDASEVVPDTHHSSDVPEP